MFSQRENQTKTLVTRDPKELFNFLVSQLEQVNRIREVNEELIVALAASGRSWRMLTYCLCGQL